MKVVKKGNVICTMSIVLTLLIFMCFFFLIFQVNTIKRSIKNDLFYLSNNAILGMNKEELYFSNYEINTDKTKNILEDLLKKNHEKGYIKEIEIKDISFETKEDHIVIHLEIKVKFNPIIKIGSKETYEFFFKEDTKISLLEYN